MPTVLTPNQGETQTLPAPIRSITVQHGEILVKPPRPETPDPDVPVVDPLILKEGETFDAKDTAAIVVHDITGSRVLVVSSDELAETPVEPTEKPTKKTARRKAKKT